MGNSYARRNMWDSDYRPEQLLTRDILNELYPKLTIKLEFFIENLTLDGKPYRSSKPDIVISSKKIIIRLNGMYHYTSARQADKDFYQRNALEQAGWEVIDFDCRKMENLYKNHWTEKTFKLAREEIIEQLGKVSRL